MKKRIFVVEDDKDIAYILNYLLVDEGYEVMVFETVTAFKKVIQEQVPDLFLLDVMLPDGNGLELCNEIKSNPILSDQPVFMMSAHLPENIAHKSCADAFLTKPFDLDVMLQRIGSYMRPN